MKGQFGEGDPRLSGALVARELSNEALEGFGGLVVALRRLGEPFLEQKIAARVISCAAARQLFRVGQEPVPVVLLEPGERSVKQRIAAEAG